MKLKEGRLGRLGYSHAVGTAFLLASACSSEDATILWEVEENQPGSGGTGQVGSARGGSGGASESGSAQGGAGGTQQGNGGTEQQSNGGAEQGHGGSELQGTGGTEQGTGGTTQEPVEYWENGATVSSVSTTSDDRFHGVAMDAQNNVYAVGYFGTSPGEDRTQLIVKYKSDGALDTTFGSNGRVDVNFSTYLGTPVGGTVTTADASAEEARDVRLQSDGKIVIVGRAEDPSNLAPDNTTPIDIVVFRLNADGSRDNTFGSNGSVVLNPGNGINDLAWGVDVDASNRIYVFGHGTATPVAGAVTPRTDQDRYAWRLTQDGALDTAFGAGGTGFFTFDIPQGTTTMALNDNQRRGVALAGGGAVLSGYTNVGGRNQVVLARVLDTGLPDPSFSNDGIVRLAPFPTGLAEAYGVAVQSNGSLVTTGYGNPDAERPTPAGGSLLDMVSFRVTASGAADPTWGVAGAVAYDPGGGEDRGRAILALADDRILIAGAATTTPQNKDAMLLLLEKNGAPALDFDPAVHKGYDFGGDNEEFFSLALSPSGDFVAAAGYATGGGLANGNGVVAIVPVHD